MKRITWGDAFSFLGWLAIATAISLITIFIIVDKPTVNYSLGVDINDNKLSIIREIQWYSDDAIILDRSITYFEAIRMVDSLNKTLPKKSSKP